MRILSIETSCDETSMALVELHKDSADGQTILIHSHMTASQAMLHAQYGGVFPVVAKREHVKALTPLFTALLDESKSSIKENEWSKVENLDEKIHKVKEILYRDPELSDDLVHFIKESKLPKIDAISVTSGPGLEIALWVGITFAKALGQIFEKPVIGINHMLGHLVSPMIQANDLRKKIDFTPIPDNSLALLISGGHTELVSIEKDSFGHYKFQVIGETLDDAIGEAYDKVARLMGLLYPGGPRIAKLAEKARSKNIDPVILPRPMIHSGDYNFSYSGLKTAVMYYTKQNKIETDEQKMALALGFENAATDVILKKVKNALVDTGATSLLLGGGVSANVFLRNGLQQIANDLNIELHSPLNALTGDNALMIALATFIKTNNSILEDESGSIVADGTLSIA